MLFSLVCFLVWHQVLCHLTFKHSRSALNSGSLGIAAEHQDRTRDNRKREWRKRRRKSDVQRAGLDFAEYLDEDSLRTLASENIDRAIYVVIFFYFLFTKQLQ